MQFHLDFSKENFLEILSWNSIIKEDKTLKILAQKEHAYIMRELDYLEIPREGIFVKVEGSSNAEEDPEHTRLYIYGFNKHLSYSSVNMTRIAGFCNIEECEDLVSPCDTIPCHEHYLPFLLSNNQCRTMIRDDDTSELSTLLNTGNFGDQQMSGNYNENAWTKRLYHCLTFKDVVAEYTANLTYRDTTESWKKRIPREVDERSLLFSGSPDMIITMQKNEGVLDVGPRDDRDGDNEVSSDGDNSPCSSQESGKLQMGHQMTNSKAYKVNSLLTEKVGELVAALHNGLACRALRRYVRRGKVSSLTAHGLHIHRSLGIYHLEVTLSDTDRLKVKATQLVDGLLLPGLFCPAIKLFMEKLSDHS